MSDEQSSTQTSSKFTWKAILSLEASDQVFVTFLSLSFIILVILAFLGRAAEMTVLAGFSAISMAFMKLELFSEFSALGFSAKLKDVVQTVKALADRETEIDLDESVDEAEQPAIVSISQNERRALEAIYTSKFTFRSAGGISQQLQVSPGTASRLLFALQEKGLVAQAATSKRRSVWNITESGISYLARTKNEESEAEPPQ